jgi:hypothetical protein
MIELSKSEKRELRSLAGEAYRAGLAQHIEKLEAAFVSWRKGDISVFDLDDRIHEYHSGPRKQLYNFYQMQNQPEAAVAHALAHNLIDRDKVSALVAEKIEHLVRFFMENRK